MGVVYRAHDRELERDVALKLHARVGDETAHVRRMMIGNFGER